MTDESNEQEVMGEMNQRFKELSVARVRAEANLENAQKNLEKIAEDAMKQFGTCDISELKAQLAKIEEENERRKTEYLKHLEKIETDLAQVESSEENG